MKEILRTAKNIKGLRIQGATNVAIAATQSLLDYSLRLKVRNPKEYVKKFNQAAELLKNCRATEPMMKNSINYLSRVMSKNINEGVDELKEILKSKAWAFLQDLKKVKLEAGVIASNYIEPNSVILTHCHSGTVIEALVKAKDNLRMVYCTETRPLYQGRLTAKDLTRNKIPTTMIVDSAVASIMNKIDLVIVGADAITAQGHLFNKIGTHGIAIIAEEFSVPLISATSLLKYSSETISGRHEQIDKRKSSEVWARPPKGLNIINNAFDITPRDLIEAFATEAGVITPNSVHYHVRKKYPWI